MKPIHSLSDDELLQLLKRAAALPDAPAWLVSAAVDLWRTHGIAPAGPLRRPVATLSFDSWAAPAVAAGMRSLPSDIRHLLYSAAGCDIDLRIAPAGDRFELAGQLLGRDEAGTLEIVRCDDPDAGPATIRELQFDALGEFRVDGVSAGRYRLILHFGGVEIELPVVEVGTLPGRGSP